MRGLHNGGPAKKNLIGKTFQPKKCSRRVFNGRHGFHSATQYSGRKDGSLRGASEGQWVLACPIYLFFGGKDSLIPTDHVDQIKTKLTDEKKNFTMEVYPEATHGFFCDERPSYHEASAKDAWEKTKAFFAQHLK